jgi:hypothetical protein
MASPLRYAIPFRDSLPGWRDRLLEALPLEADSPERYRIYFFDSFDWRLFRAGKALRWEERDADSRCSLSARDGGGTAVSMPLHQPPPRFPCELPEGKLRRRLESLLGPRALLPVATLATRSQCLRLTDPEGKTRARLFLEQHRLLTPDSTARPLVKQLRVEALRGYAGAASSITDRLQEGFGLQPDAQDLLNCALSRQGTDPAASAHRLDIELDPFCSCCWTPWRSTSRACCRTSTASSCTTSGSPCGAPARRWANSRRCSRRKPWPAIARNLPGWEP